MLALALGVVGVAWAGTVAYAVWAWAGVARLRLQGRSAAELAAVVDRVTKLENRWTAAVAAGSTRRLG